MCYARPRRLFPSVMGHEGNSVAHGTMFHIYNVACDTSAQNPKTRKALKRSSSSHLATRDHWLDVPPTLLGVNKATPSRLAQVVLSGEVQQLRVDRGGVNVEHELLHRSAWNTRRIDGSG